MYSYHQFMDDSLHHPAWGYYTDGRIRFGESADSADFTTFPVTMRPLFGALLAERAKQKGIEGLEFSRSRGPERPKHRYHGKVKEVIDAIVRGGVPLI